MEGFSDAGSTPAASTNKNQDKKDRQHLFYPDFFARFLIEFILKLRYSKLDILLLL